MSSRKQDNQERRKSRVLEMARFFEKRALSESYEPTSNQHSSTTYVSQQEATMDIEEEEICVEFEKCIGRIPDFEVFFGKNSRGITGLFIRNVWQRSCLVNKMKKEDRIITVNGEDVKTLEDDAFKKKLDNLSGLVTLKLLRLKHHKEIDKQRLKEMQTPVRQPLDTHYRNPTAEEQNSLQHCENMGQEIRQHAALTNQPAKIKNEEQQKSSDCLTPVQPWTNTVQGNRQPNEPANIRSGEQQKLKPDQQTSVQTRHMVQRNSQLDTISTNQWTNMRETNQQERTFGTNQVLPTKPRTTVTEAKKPLKDIDSISDVAEMLKLFQLLDISHDQENLILGKMKEKAKKKIQEQSSGSGKYSNGITGFHVISNAKKRDIRMRRKLKEIYSKFDECLAKVDEDIISILNIEDRDILKVHKEQRQRLEEQDYHLLVTGESSAGKSTLLNLILGEELLPQDVLHATSTICELKYGEKRELVAHYKSDKKPSPEKIALKTEDECGKTYQEQITPYMFLDQNRRREGSEFSKVELFWPNELLQEGVVIIDTPGVGESNDMDQILMNYLPNAFAFINVIDLSHSGGLQEEHKKKLTRILKKMQSFGCGTEHLSKCSLFIGNKWDLILKKDRDQVKEYVAKSLSECWQDANLTHQTTYISALQGVQLQQYGGVTSEFQDLLQTIRKMVLRAIDVRLYDHWKWLDYVLARIFWLANRFIFATQSSTDEKSAKIEERSKRIDDIEKKKDHLKKEIKEKINEHAIIFLNKLEGYVHSPEFQQEFCSWSGSPAPLKEDTWSSTKANIKNAIEDRLLEFLEQWETKSQYHETFHKELVVEFRKSLNLMEEKLGGGDITHTMAEQVDYLNNRSQMSTKAKILVGATSPLWIPVGVAGFVISMPVFAGLTLKRKISEKIKLDEYEKTPSVHLKKLSEKFLASDKAAQAIKKYVAEQMGKTNDVFMTYFKNIPRLIQADRKFVRRLGKEKSNLGNVLKQYIPIKQKSEEIRRNMISLGLEVSPATVDEGDLEWKTDKDSCLGEGEFSLVYRGRLKSGNPNTNLDVAVKVFKKPFDDQNSRFYLNEETAITSLDHPNVLKFYGVIKMKVSNTSNDYKFGFVMKYCEANLKTIIFNGNLSPAISTDSIEKAIVPFLQLAAEIAEGLNYIHESSLVHRHLKLENILVNKCGNAMIGDVGIVGEFKETEKSIIYLAPEVLKDRKNCTKAADIYSFGIMMWEMWYGKQAFMELMPLDKAKFQEKLDGGYRPPQENLKVSLPGPHSIMTSCWESDLLRRPSANECATKLSEMSNLTIKAKQEKLDRE